MSHAKEPTPQQKADELNENWEASRQAAESRPQGHPAQLPVNPLTGSDEPHDDTAGQ